MFHKTVAFSVEDSCRTLDAAGWMPLDLLALSDDDAFELFLELRYPETAGKPWCPRCLCKKHTNARSATYRCQNCKANYDPMTGTCFSSKHMSYQSHLAIISSFGRSIPLYTPQRFAEFSGKSDRAARRACRKIHARHNDAGLKQFYSKRAWSDPFWGRLFTTIYEMRDKAVEEYRELSEPLKDGERGKQIKDAIEYGDRFLLSTY